MYNLKYFYFINRKMVVICVEGAIGVGKSTLLESIQEQVDDFTCLQEPVHKWTNFNNVDMLKLFNNNMKKNGVTFQQVVMLTLYEREINSRNPKNVILERSIGSSFHVFATVLQENGCIDNTQKNILKYFYKFYVRQLRPIDLLIYLDCRPEIALERIKKRNRPGEENICLEYLKQLDTAYKKYLEHCSTKVVVISTENIEKKNIVDSVVQIIKKTL